MFTTIQFAISDGIAVITLDRPGVLNAFNMAMCDDLLAALDRTDGDDDVRAVVVTGAGRAFCAGADMSAGAAAFDQGDATSVIAPPADLSPNERIRDSGGRVALRLFRSLKPVIGAINGAAFGVGATMTLPMDIRIASDGARFGFPFAQRGIVPESASAWFLPRIVPIAKALEWCLTGRPVTADEALAANLVNAVVAPDALIDRAIAIARGIRDQAAPVSAALTRQMLWRMLGADHPMAAHRLDSHLVSERGMAADAREGVASFLEKRPAVFSDRVSDAMPPSFPWWPEGDDHWGG